jgi:hypothetical protein
MKYFIYFEVYTGFDAYNLDWGWSMRDFDDICVAKAALDRMLKAKKTYRNVSDILIKYQESNED